MNAGEAALDDELPYGSVWRHWARPQECPAALARHLSPTALADVERSLVDRLCAIGSRALHRLHRESASDHQQVIDHFSSESGLRELLDAFPVLDGLFETSIAHWRARRSPMAPRHRVRPTRSARRPSIRSAR